MNRTVSSREGPPLTTEAEAAPAGDVPRLITPTYSPSEELLRKYCRYADIEEKYHIEPEVLGIGHHGSVRRCVDNATGQRYAVKSINKMEPNVSVPGLVREMALLGEVDHDNVISMTTAFEDFEHVHIITELCEGGELFDKIAERNSADNGAVCFAEDEAARILHQVLSAVAYLHSKGIAHRDIKPENILFATKEEGSPIKIIDLGLSRKHHPDEPPMTSFVGTSYYVAPEVLRQRYDKACDLWSVGVITYLLLCGYPPFNGKSNTEVYKSVYRGQFCFPIEDWKDISIEAMHFIHRLLTKDPKRRMTAQQALEHPWIKKHVPVDTDVAMGEAASGDANANVMASERRSSGEIAHGGCAQRMVEEALEQFGGEGGICGAVFDMDL